MHTPRPGPDTGDPATTRFHVNDALTHEVLAYCDTRDAADRFTDSYEAEYGPGTTYLHILDSTTDPASVLYCLFCGATGDDITEEQVTVSERVTEYALRCGLCGGMWAP